LEETTVGDKRYDERACCIPTRWLENPRDKYRISGTRIQARADPCKQGEVG
jgi:hypothetical protein